MYGSPVSGTAAAGVGESSKGSPFFEEGLHYISGQSPADQSLLPPGAGDLDLWRGWTIQTSNDGRLFYHHVATGTSQWQMPRELTPVLGEWSPVEEGDGESGYWRNELLGVSTWKDPRRTTNLFQAALDGDLFFLQLYAEVGGFLDAVDAKGRTALHYNCAGGSMQAVLYLLQRQASLELPDRAGSTPLHWASRYGHAPIVRVLLEASSNPDRQNSLGDTSLHEAAALGRVEPMHWLLLSRADPAPRNREDRTPAEVAARNQQTEAETLLLKHEESHRRRSWRGRTRDAPGGAAEPQEEPRPAGPGASEPEQSEESDTDVPETPTARVLEELKNKERRGYQHSESGSGTDQDEPEPSLALVVVRAARPLLRGLQWLANRVLGEKKTDLGANNKFCYDDQTGQWVLRRDVDRRRRLVTHTDAEDSGSSVASGEEEGTWSLPERRPQMRRKRLGNMATTESEGVPGLP